MRQREYCEQGTPTTLDPQNAPALAKEKATRSAAKSQRHVQRELIQGQVLMSESDSRLLSPAGWVGGRAVATRNLDRRVRCRWLKVNLWKFRQDETWPATATAAAQQKLKGLALWGQPSVMTLFSDSYLAVMVCADESSVAVVVAGGASGFSGAIPNQLIAFCWSDRFQ